MLSTSIPFNDVKARAGIYILAPDFENTSASISVAGGDFTAVTDLGGYVAFFLVKSFNFLK